MKDTSLITGELWHSQDRSVLLSAQPTTYIVSIKYSIKAVSSLTMPLIVRRKVKTTMKAETPCSCGIYFIRSELQAININCDSA